MTQLSSRTLFTLHAHICPSFLRFPCSFVSILLWSLIISSRRTVNLMKRSHLKSHTHLKSSLLLRYVFSFFFFFFNHTQVDARYLFFFFFWLFHRTNHNLPIDDSVCAFRRRNRMSFLSLFNFTPHAPSSHYFESTVPISILQGATLATRRTFLPLISISYWMRIQLNSI